MAHPNMQAAMDIYQTGRALGINFLREQQAQKEFQKQGALAGYISGHLLPDLSNPTSPMTPQRAAADVIQKGADLGISAKSSLGLFSAIGSLAGKKAKEEGVTLNALLEDTRAGTLPATEGSLKMAEMGQKVYSKTAGGARRTAYKEAVPAVINALQNIQRARRAYPNDWDDFLDKGLEGTPGGNMDVPESWFFQKNKRRKEIVPFLTRYIQDSVETTLLDETIRRMVDKVIDNPEINIEKVVHEEMGLSPVRRETASVPE